jgi:hypothetical protein
VLEKHDPVPSKAQHSSALTKSGDYSGGVQRCNPYSRGCTRAETATQIVQLVTAIVGLLTVLAPLIVRLM